MQRLQYLFEAQELVFFFEKKTLCSPFMEQVQLPDGYETLQREVTFNPYF